MFCDVRREIDGSVFENFAVVLDGRGSDSKQPSKNKVSCRVQEFLGECPMFERRIWSPTEAKI